MIKSNNKNKTANGVAVKNATQIASTKLKKHENKRDKATK